MASEFEKKGFFFKPIISKGYHGPKKNLVVSYSVLDGQLRDAKRPDRNTPASEAAVTSTKKVTTNFASEVPSFDEA